MWGRCQKGNNATFSAFTPFSVTSPTSPMTGAPIAVALVASLRVGKLAYILGWWGPFKQNLLKDWQFVLPPQPPLAFTEVMKFYFPGAGTLGCTVWPGAGFTHSTVVLPGFNLPHMNVGLPVPLLPPPFWCHSASSPPWLPSSSPPANLDEYGFFKPLVVWLLYSLMFWQFWVLFVLRLVVILLVVVWGVSTYAFILTESPRI